MRVSTTHFTGAMCFGAAPVSGDAYVTTDKPDPYEVAVPQDEFVIESATDRAPATFPIGSQMVAPLVRPLEPSPEALNPFVTRERTWSFVVDDNGQAIELGAGRFAKAYLGEERWLQSKTALRRPVAIKCLQRGVEGEDLMRFQIEKEILERVQGHPNIVELLGSGEAGSPGCSDAFLPPSVRDKLENDFMVLELLDLSLEERLKGARHKRRRDDLLAVPMPERIFRVLDYVLPVACAVEFAHLVRNTSHRDIKPANILIKLPDPNLRGSQMRVKLADFNVAKAQDTEVTMTRHQPVPGTMYFQSPEQETNTVELLVNCTQGSPEIDFFEDFYMDIFRNDTFSLFNRSETYVVMNADRARKKLILDRPFGEPSEVNVRGRIVKAVGRPADIYSLGALLYYLVSGAYGNPKTLFDAFRRFVEYDKQDEANTIAAYLEHEYSTIQAIRAPKVEAGAADMAYEDKFFSYKQYLDGNGELIDRPIMMIIAKAMIRNKPDSYCLSYDLETAGISTMVHDLLALSIMYGVDPNVRLARSSTHYQPPKKTGPMRRAFDKFFFK
jgi:serine/threonine protein kinase